MESTIKFLQQCMQGMRLHTMEEALRLAEKNKVQTIVETGTARYGMRGFDGDGSFTIIFGHYISQKNKENPSVLYELWSVDISESSVKTASEAVVNFQPFVHVIQDDSIHFLKEWNVTEKGLIPFLYLDSFDFSFSNPRPSQEHHLREIEAAYEKLAPNAIVMIDDCDLPHGGKGALVIPWLEARGWRKHLSGYQVILLRD